VFVAGGMTNSEMREAYLMSNQLGKDIFIGAATITCADDFINFMLMMWV
jgi:syntaxin-binding protein 1